MFLYFQVSLKLTQTHIYHEKNISFFFSTIVYDFMLRKAHPVSANKKR